MVLEQQRALNISKMKELAIDLMYLMYRAAVEMVDCVMFLDIHITGDLIWCSVEGFL